MGKLRRSYYSKTDVISGLFQIYSQKTIYIHYWEVWDHNETNVQLYVGRHKLVSINCPLKFSS